VNADQQAERLERAIEQGRELLRELNGTHKDLLRTIREAREASRDEIDRRINEYLAERLEALGETCTEQMRICVDKINSEFERLGKILLGVDKGQSLEDIVAAVAEFPGHRIVQPFDSQIRYDADVLNRK
jgi:DNA anti-recombination protein RmuC